MIIMINKLIIAEGNEGVNQISLLSHCYAWPKYSDVLIYIITCPLAWDPGSRLCVKVHHDQFPADEYVQMNRWRVAQ